MLEVGAAVLGLAVLAAFGREDEKEADAEYRRGLQLASDGNLEQAATVLRGLGHAPVALGEVYERQRRFWATIGAYLATVAQLACTKEFWADIGAYLATVAQATCTSLGFWAFLAALACSDGKEFAENVRKHLKTARKKGFSYWTFTVCGSVFIAFCAWWTGLIALLDRALDMLGVKALFGLAVRVDWAVYATAVAVLCTASAWVTPRWGLDDFFNTMHLILATVVVYGVVFLRLIVQPFLQWAISAGEPVEESQRLEDAEQAQAEEAEAELAGAEQAGAKQAEMWRAEAEAEQEEVQAEPEPLAEAQHHAEGQAQPEVESLKVERQAQLEAERHAQLEAERQAQLEAERHAQLEAERQAQLEAEAERQAQPFLPLWSEETVRGLPLLGEQAPPELLLPLLAVLACAFVLRRVRSTTPKRTTNVVPTPTVSRGKVTLGAVVGYGSFGVVRKARWKGSACAAKGLHTHDPVSLRRLAAEARVLTKLRHPFVISFFGVSDDNRFMLMELAERSLRDVLAAGGGETLNDPMRFSILHDVVRGMCGLHGNDPRVLHRDLKPSNVLLMNDGHAKIADFGLAVLDTASRSSGRGLGYGTFAYTAPELFRDEQCTPASDVYAFGVLTFELATGQPAWADMSQAAIMGAVVTGERPALPDGTDAFLADVVRRAWAQAPEDRASFEDLVQEFAAVADDYRPGGSPDPADLILAALAQLSAQVCDVSAAVAPPPPILIS